MNTTVKRKTTAPSSSSHYSSDPSSSRSPPSTDGPEEKYKEPVFRHGELLITSLIPAILVMLAFGGKPSLVAICFGSLFSYIFDVLGAMEATVLCVVVSLMSVWGTLLYSARHLLEESLMNMSVLFVLSLVLIMVFFSVGGMFRGLRMEFDAVFYFMETLMFSSIPLLNASVVSWFLSVEFPMMDLGFTFTTCYYLFLVVLAYPRLCSQPVISHRNKTSNKFVLSFPVLYAMYLIPVVMSPVLYLTLHHNVSMTSMHRLVGMILSIFYPVLMVILAAERHTDYYPDESRKAVSNFLFIGKVFVSLGMVILFQSNDIIEEIKFFSGLPEPFASLTIIFSASLLLLSALLNNLKQAYDTDELLRDDADVMGRPVSSAYEKKGIFSPSTLKPLTDACYMGAILIVYVILGILSPTSEPQEAMVTVASVFVGCLSLTEYYNESQIPVPSTGFIDVQAKNGVRILLAGASAAYGMHLFTLKHLQFLDFTLEWSFGTVHLQTLCTLSALLTGGAIMIPTLMFNPKARTSSRSTTLGFVPGENNDGGNSGLIDVKTSENYASLMFVFFSMGLSGFELLVREQDWTEVAGGANSDDVYPAYFLACTAVLFIVVTLHLCSIEVVGIATLWIVGLTQSCKMLHLIDFSSELCFCILSLLVSLSQPFVLYLRDGWKEINNTAADVVNGVGSSVIWAPRIGFTEGLWYILMCGLSCDLAARSFVPLVLVEVTGREVTSIQCHALGWSMWCFFCAAMSFCFLREAAMIRSFLCLAGGLCFMVAGNALGTLNITYDASSPFLFTFQLLEDAVEGEEGAVDHGGIYASMTAVLCVASFLGILPLKTALQRVMYLLCFTYCCAMACFWWAFPESASRHGSVVTLDADSFFTFPWMLCLVSVFFSTSTILNMSSAASGGGRWMLTLSAAAPIGFTCFTLLSEDHSHYLDGTLFLNMSVQFCTAVCSRLLVFSKQNDPGNLSTRATASQIATATFAETICMISSVLALGFGVMHCLFSQHIICDFAVPLLSVVLATSNDFGWNMSGIISAVYWTLSALYSLFVKDYNGLEFLHEFATPLHGQKGIFADADLSFWSTELSEGGFAWLTWMHLFLLLLALGPIIMSVFRGESAMDSRGHSAQQRGRNDGSDDILFVVSVIAFIPIITAQLWSIRLLGILGVVFGVCNAYQYSRRQRISDNVI